MLSILYLYTLYFISYVVFLFFFFNDTATTEIYTLSLHDALPISSDQAANSRNLTGVRLSQCCESGAVGCRTDNPGQWRQTYLLWSGSHRAKQLQVWRHGRGGRGRQVHRAVRALESVNRRRTGHSRRRPERSAPL